MARTRDTSSGFETVRIEGALLAADWLGRIARQNAAAQEDADYRVRRGLTLREEVGQYWKMARFAWTEAERAMRAKQDPAEVARAFVKSLLGECLGWGSLESVAPVTMDGRAHPIGLAALAGRVPVVIAAFGAGLESLDARFGDVGRRRSAFGLAQEFLNASDDALWGIATDGRTLRILRDNASLTRPAWISVDLARMFNENLYADFVAFWLLAHETRFGREARPSVECPLEVWREAGLKEGIPARARLRGGVERALLALGGGFLAQPSNVGLHEALRSGTLTRDGYHQELVRLVYRLIFVLTIEERGVLHPVDATPEARSLYARGYGIARLRERALRGSAADRHLDQWESLRVVFRGLAVGEPRLGLPALGGLFAAAQLPNLRAAKLSNEALLTAVFHLSWLDERGGLTRVNWKDMGPEEFGSVYEGLLELVPVVSLEANGFSFASGGEGKGNDRKKSGSYYTPDSLVQVLLDGALEPVMRDTIDRNPGRAADALLELSIVDPACGSGHFLLAAARRLADRVARARVNATPSQPDYRRAVRQVVASCLYGVDLNPMAVELCKVALWMEAVEPGLPLTFLDAHIRHGNALVGVTPGLMGDGVPDAAWAALVDDDRAAARMLKARNENERGDKNGLGRGQMSMASMFASRPTELGAVARAHAALDAAADDSPAALAAKEARWAEILGSSEYQHQHFLADAWCAAFVWPKPGGVDDGDRPLAHPVVEAAPTTALWRDIRDGRGRPPALTVSTTQRITEEYKFFHWHLAFPAVFDRGGFDVVLGNPPWERVKLQELEFFASRNPEIGEAPTAAARKKLIDALQDSDPFLSVEWTRALRKSDGETRFIRESGRYPLCGEGDINTYALFAEHNRACLAPRGAAGFIVPTGIATDDSTKRYFGALVAGSELARFYSFENEEFVFPEVHHAFKFALVALDRSGRSDRADLFFFARQAAHLADQARHFTLTPADFTALNPNTRTCPTFRTRRDADLNLGLYRRAGVLWRDGDPLGNPWGLGFMRMFDMATDSDLFRSRADLMAQGLPLVGNRFGAGARGYLPLMEGRMADHYDHRYASVVVEDVRTKVRDASSEFLTEGQKQDPDCVPLPRHWIAAAAVDERLRQVWDRGWLLGWRDITASTNARTVIATVVPRVAVGHTTPVMFGSTAPSLTACLYANLSSFILDYAARQKVGGTHLTYGYLKQLPTLAPPAYASPAPWHPIPAGTEAPTVLGWMLPRIIELTYTSWDLAPFAADVGYGGPPFRWESGRRMLLRAELEAAFLHLYVVNREDAAYVLDSFRVVCARNPGQAALILSIYDAMAEATRTGVPYVTRLDPPPADPRVAHPPRLPATVAP